ncbi:hypothetical protein [Nocardioides glacieisoli]|nr:hypothetical protein [Nocardioides glacieisoli]
MKYLEQLAWVGCSHPGCPEGRTFDSRHLDNLNASGGWSCPNHEGRAA